MSWILSPWGAVPAAVYLVVAVLLVRGDRTHLFHAAGVAGRATTARSMLPRWRS